MTFWTKENLKECERLCAEKLSAAMIAAQIGATRNMVIGVARRRGWELSYMAQHPKKRAARLNFSAVTGEPLPPKVNIRPRLGPHGAFVMATEIEPVPVVPAEEIAMRPCSVLDLDDNRCRWPVDGEGFETIFCGAAPADGCVYCGPHARIAFQPLQSRRPGGFQIR